MTTEPVQFSPLSPVEREYLALCEVPDSDPATWSTWQSNRLPDEDEERS